MGGIMASHQYYNPEVQTRIMMQHDGAICYAIKVCSTKHYNEAEEYPWLDNLHGADGNECALTSSLQVMARYNLFYDCGAHHMSHVLHRVWLICASNCSTVP